MHKHLVVLFVFTSFFLVQASVARAQDTFGPICDGVTVTCPPTPPPVAIDTPTSQSALQPTTPPNAPPRSGHGEILLAMLGLSGICIVGGVFLRRSYIEE